MPEASEYTGLSIGLAAFGAAIALAASGWTSEATTPGTAHGYPSSLKRSVQQATESGPIATTG
jgi:hypothetical protein